jgi:hypothetical protein
MSASSSASSGVSQLDSMSNSMGAVQKEKVFIDFTCLDHYKAVDERSICFAEATWFITPPEEEYEIPSF